MTTQKYARLLKNKLREVELLAQSARHNLSDRKVAEALDDIVDLAEAAEAAKTLSGKVGAE